MTTRARIVVTLFILLQALAAFSMAALSVHGVAGQAMAAPIYFLAAAGITWWAGKRLRSTLLVAGVAVLMVLAAPGVVGVLGYIEAVVDQRRVAKTRVSDVTDEPILSADGRPIGVRVSYTLVVPTTGYAWISPSLHGSGQRVEHLSLGSRRSTVDGSGEPVKYQRGKPHRVVDELYPSILFFARDRRCLQSSLTRPLPEDSDARPLRISIFGTPYGDTRYGGPEQFTRGSYDLAELYRSVLAEGLSPC